MSAVAAIRSARSAIARRNETADPDGRFCQHADARIGRFDCVMMCDGRQESSRRENEEQAE